MERCDTSETKIDTYITSPSNEMGVIYPTPTLYPAVSRSPNPSNCLKSLEVAVPANAPRLSPPKTVLEYPSIRFTPRIKAASLSTTKRLGPLPTRPEGEANLGTEEKWRRNEWQVKNRDKREKNEGK